MQKSARWGRVEQDTKEFGVIVLTVKEIPPLPLQDELREVSCEVEQLDSLLSEARECRRIDQPVLDEPESLLLAA